MLLNLHVFCNKIDSHFSIFLIILETLVAYFKAYSLLL
jgi:hypothetical protein